MIEKIYHGYVKHIQHTEISFTEDNLENLLGELAAWRKESNQHLNYDLTIRDQYGNLIFESRF